MARFLLISLARVAGRFLGAVLLAAVALSSAEVSVRGDTPDRAVEYRIKSAYLFNFTKFIEWPPPALAAADAPLHVGVLDGDTDAARIVAEVLQGKTTPRGHKISVRRLVALDATALECHVLFVTRGAKVSPAAARAAIGNRPVLLVGEEDEFAEQGGTINFVVSGDVVRFEINPRRAASDGLRVSGALACVARLVRDKDAD